ncbi:NucA/NucB deoxyribonuclease domain-containing protein [Actinomadura gamaensis]|uniref:Deoxyribonuclease NucA/NucB domain-containing protein n=1 Tax=Actinomadura gamaensis TaxID=1763541 RepID=A0ABV9TS01_9ACTN
MIAVLLAPLTLGVPAASASTSKAKEPEFWYTRPLEVASTQPTPLKSPPEPQARPKAASLQEVQRSTREHSYEVDAANPKSEPGVTAAADPLADCAKQKVSNPQHGLVQSHFLFCTKGNSEVIHQTGKKITGGIHYHITVVGTGRNGKREIDFQMKLVDIVPWGDVEKLNIHLQFYIYCGPLRSNDAGCKEGFSPTAMKRVSTWQHSPYDSLMKMTSPSNVGQGPEKVNFTRWQLLLKSPEIVVINHVPLIDQSARFDSASYLPKKIGAVFNQVTPHLLFRRAARYGVPETANHLWRACNQPASTIPTIKNKRIPGCKNEDPLHRLYHPQKKKVKVGKQTLIYDRYERNRAMSIRTCRAKWPGYPDHGNDCDEFPFASTYEGADAPGWDRNAVPGRYSVYPVKAADNQKGGNMISVWYGQDRILDWSGKDPVSGTTWRDPFVIWVR